MIEIDQELIISPLTVTVNIDHPRPSDLTIFLTDPILGEPIQLQLGQDVVDDFNASGSQGIWMLNVTDSRKRQEGELMSWSITVDY